MNPLLEEYNKNYQLTIQEYNLIRIADAVEQMNILLKELIGKGEN